MSKIVLGGGIGGLTTAYYLSKGSQKCVRIYEATDRLGGWIKTMKTPDGTLFEQGARTIRPVGIQGRNTLKLIEELGLTSSVKPIKKSHSAARNRMIYVNNNLYTLPNSLISVFRKIPPFSQPLALSIWKDLFAPSKKVPDESIYDFVERRLGREIADYAISPMICGICAGDAREISVKFLMKSLFEKEQRYGGIVKGLIRGAGSVKTTVMEEKSELCERAVSDKWSVWSLDNGLETLPRRLNGYLVSKKVEMELNSRVEKIELSPGKVEVTVNGIKEVAEKVYSSLPSWELAKLIGGEHHFLKEELSAIPFVTVGVVNLEFEGSVLENDGFGFLVPPNQNLPILGVIFDTCCFPQEGRTVLTVMMGGKWFEQQFGVSPKESSLLDTAKEQVKMVLNIQQEPKRSSVNILRNCIPQYIIGHEARVSRIREYLLEKKIPLELVGASYDGVGVNDVILSAKYASER